MSGHGLKNKTSRERILFVKKQTLSQLEESCLTSNQEVQDVFTFFLFDHISCILCPVSSSKTQSQSLKTHSQPAFDSNYLSFGVIVCHPSSFLSDQLRNSCGRYCVNYSSCISSYLAFLCNTVGSSSQAYAHSEREDFHFATVPPD